MKKILQDLQVVLLALLVAMAAGSVLVLLYGGSPAQVYGMMLSRTWGDWHGFGQVLYKSTPLIFTGLSVALGLRAGLFNIGAEGQVMAGAFAMAVAGSALSGSPAGLGLIAAVLCGVATAALLGALCGWLKARFHAHEVITTIMLNFIVYAAVSGVGRRFFYVAQTLHTPALPEALRLPSLGLEGSAASVAFFLAVLVACAVAFFFARTRLGFEFRAMGENLPAATAAGFPVRRHMVAVMALCGALAGLVGTATVLGNKGYFEEGVDVGNGFMGIAVALLASKNPLAILPAALLFGTLSQGGLAVNALVPKEIVDVLQAVVILAVAVTSEAFRRVVGEQLAWVRKKPCG